MRVSGKQNSLFPLGPVIKFLIYFVIYSGIKATFSRVSCSSVVESSAFFLKKALDSTTELQNIKIFIKFIAWLTIILCKKPLHTMPSWIPRFSWVLGLKICAWIMQSVWIVQIIWPLVQAFLQLKHYIPQHAFVCSSQLASVTPRKAVP